MKDMTLNGSRNVSCDDLCFSSAKRKLTCRAEMTKAGLSDPCPLVEKTLALYGIRRMIMGHTPDTEVRIPPTSALVLGYADPRPYPLQGIVHMCDGKVIVIDTGGFRP